MFDQISAAARATFGVSFGQAKRRTKTAKAKAAGEDDRARADRLSRVRTALELLEQTCAVPGCTNPRIEHDHATPHADHGPCSTANLRPLSTYHHRPRTHHGYELAGPPDDRQRIGPDGRVLFADRPQRAP